MEPCFEILAEAVVQLVVELFVEFGLRRARGAVERPANPWLAAIAYAVLGAAAGGVSVMVFPAHFLDSSAARYVNLLLTPIGAGIAMALVGAWRRRREQPLIGLDKFAYGWLFALAMACVRLALCDQPA